jgi:hypothetical protein
VAHGVWWGRRRVVSAAPWQEVWCGVRQRLTAHQQQQPTASVAGSSTDRRHPQRRRRPTPPRARATRTPAHTHTHTHTHTHSHTHTHTHTHTHSPGHTHKGNSQLSHLRLCPAGGGVSPNRYPLRPVCVPSAQNEPPGQLCPPRCCELRRIAADARLMTEAMAPCNYVTREGPPLRRVWPPCCPCAAWVGLRRNSTPQIVGWGARTQERCRVQGEAQLQLLQTPVTTRGACRASLPLSELGWSDISGVTRTRAAQCLHTHHHQAYLPTTHTL